MCVFDLSQINCRHTLTIIKYLLNSSGSTGRVLFKIWSVLLVVTGDTRATTAKDAGGIPSLVVGHIAQLVTFHFPLRR